MFELDITNKQLAIEEIHSWLQPSLDAGLSLMTIALKSIFGLQFLSWFNHCHQLSPNGRKATSFMPGLQRQYPGDISMYDPLVQRASSKKTKTEQKP